MKIYKSIFLLAIAGLVFSCGQRNPSGENAAEATSELSNIEKEHQLDKASYADSVNQGFIEDTIKGSARREAKGTVENTEVTINYGSPGARGRVIWNGLVSYDQVWVSGSHWATAVSFSQDVLVEGIIIPSGTYGFFTIPGKDEWTLILNKNFDMHLADDYNESEDLVRVKVKPENLDNTIQRLTYEVESTSDSTADITLSWDKIKVKMPFAVK
jgi:hypothetical protein